MILPHSSQLTLGDSTDLPLLTTNISNEHTEDIGDPEAVYYVVVEDQDHQQPLQEIRKNKCICIIITLCN